MKVCYVSSYPPNRGNLSEYAYNFVNSLVKNKKVEEVIVLANKHKNAKKVEIHKKMKIIRCWENNSFKIPMDILMNVKKLKIDIVHFNMGIMSWGKGRIVNFLGGLTPFLIKKILNKKVTITLHNVAEATDLSKIEGIKQSKINLFGLWLLMKLILSVDKVFVTLKSYVKILKRKYLCDNIVHIVHGTFDVKVKKVKIGGKTLLGFGHWWSCKGLSILIETFKEIQKEDEEIKLIIAGDSHPRYPTFLKKIKEKYANVPNITYTGYVPEKKIKDIFNSSTVVVLPYTCTVGSSGVLHLACSYGKPVIISDLPDIREAAKEIKASVIFVKPNDKESLKKAIKKVIYNKNFQKNIIKKNLENIKKFSFNYVTNEYVKNFEEIIKK